MVFRYDGGVCWLLFLSGDCDGCFCWCCGCVFWCAGEGDVGVGVFVEEVLSGFVELEWDDCCVWGVFGGGLDGEGLVFGEWCAVGCLELGVGVAVLADHSGALDADVDVWVCGVLEGCVFLDGDVGWCGVFVWDGYVCDLEVV